MKILAIDPGFERVGVAILKKGENHKHTLLHSCCFKTSSKLPFNERLVLIGNQIEDLIKKYEPNILAIEKLYFADNKKTAMGVSEARGVIIYCGKNNGLLVCEYTPLEIKTAITGYGRADKSMIQKMIYKLIEIGADKKGDDELDAIAIGLTCFAYKR